MKPDNAPNETQAQAEQWLLHLRSGKVTPEDLQAFRRWCADHPHMADTLRSTWTHLRTAGVRARQQQQASELPGAMFGGQAGNLSGNPSGDSRGNPSGNPSDQARGERRSRSVALRPIRPGRRAFVGVGIAAGATWLALRPPLQLWPALGELTADYRTATGEQRRIALARGVTVNMNTQTQIDVLPATGADQSSQGIRLLAGEAEIVAETVAETVTAAPPSQTDFTVLAGSGRLRTQRARFDVRRTDTQVCVTCVSGNVTVAHPQRQLTLSAGEQLIYDDRHMQPVARVDSTVVTAWRRGVLVFDGVPLRQVIDEINRYRPGKVILRNTALGSASVEAQAPITRLDVLIDTLSKAYGAHVTKLPGSIVLLT